MPGTASARGHGGSQPGARAARREHGFVVEELHPPFDTRGADPLGPPPPGRDPSRDARRRRGPRRGRRGPGARRAPGRARPRGHGHARARRHGRGDRVRAAARRRRRTGRSSARSTPPRRAPAASRRSASTRSLAARVDRHADDHPGVDVRARAAAARRCAGCGRLDAACSSPNACSATPSPRHRARRAPRLLATGHLSPTGPGLFAPAEGTASDLAGQGVADPSPMLLATALLLSEGLGRAAAGDALEDSLTVALRAPRTAVDVAGARRRRRRRASSSTPCSACCRARAATRSSHWESGDEDHRRRRDPPLPRGRGRRGDVRHPRRGDHADLRRDGARHDRAPRPRPPRAGRRAHGRRATPAPRAVSASRSRPRAPARRTSSRRSPTRGWTRRRSSASPARCARTLIGTDAFQECDITGITHADRQALVARPGREEIADGAQGRRSTSPARAAAAPSSSTSRATSRRRESTSRIPRRSTCPAGGRPRRCTRCRSARRRARSRTPRKPVLYVGGGTLNGDACEELLQLAEAGSLPVITTLMGKSAFPEKHELHFGWPGMHGAEVVEPRDEHVRRPRRDRLPLRRPRHRQALRVRARSDRRPPRRRPRRDLEASRRRHPGRRARSRWPSRELAREVARHRAEGVAAPEAWLDQIRAWREEFPLRYGSGGEWLKPQRVVEPLQALTAGDRRDRHDRRRPAPDVGDAVRP